MSSSIDAPEEVDVALLAARLGNPERFRMLEAEALVADASSGDEAWERLFNGGLISRDLFHSRERCFAVVNTERGAGAIIREPLDFRPAPATVKAAATLAADAVHVLEAERLTRLLRSQLVPWGAREVKSIEWVLLTHQISFGYAQNPSFRCALYSLEYALQDIGLAMEDMHPEQPWLPPFVNSVICADRGWATAVRESLEIPAAYGAPPELQGRTFDALENPFRTALHLWARGYVLDHFCDAELDAARLFTCVAGAPKNLLQQLREQRHGR